MHLRVSAITAFVLTVLVPPLTGRAQEPMQLTALDYIEIAKAEGARCVLGGGPAERPECGDGWFIEPTVFADVTPEMRIAREEVFGPVAGADAA